MFKQKTILILGAGASKSVCYLTGKELITNIIKTRYQSTPPHGSQRMDDFKRLLQDMQPLMIDTFLSYHTDYRDIGIKMEKL